MEDPLLGPVISAFPTMGDANVIVAFTVLSTGNPDADNLDNEARRLHSVLELAAEEAVLYGTEIGVDLARTQYRFLRLDADGWTPMTDRSSPLRPHELKPRIELRLLTTTAIDTTPANARTTRTAASATRVQLVGSRALRDVHWLGGLSTGRHGRHSL